MKEIFQKFEKIVDFFCRFLRKNIDFLISFERVRGDGDEKSFVNQFDFVIFGRFKSLSSSEKLFKKSIPEPGRIEESC